MLRLEADVSPMALLAVNKYQQCRASHRIYKDIQLTMQVFHGRRTVLQVVFRCGLILNLPDLSENGYHSNHPILRYPNTIGATLHRFQ